MTTAASQALLPSSSRHDLKNHGPLAVIALEECVLARSNSVGTCCCLRHFDSSRNDEWATAQPTSRSGGATPLEMLIQPRRKAHSLSAPSTVLAPGFFQGNLALPGRSPLSHTPLLPELLDTSSVPYICHGKRIICALRGNLTAKQLRLMSSLSEYRSLDVLRPTYRRLRLRLMMLSHGLLVAIVWLTRYASATIRFGCSQLVTERFDPLVTPGQVAPHVHQIIGGNAFNLSMDPRDDYSETATCTTCRFKEDKSNYWTAILYFKHSNGSYIRVPQKPNHVVGNTNGGHTVYYIAGYPPFQKVTAFAKGFRMITGNPMIRVKGDRDLNDVFSHAITFRCWEDDEWLGESNHHAPGIGRWDSVGLPKTFCPGGIRSNIFFPSCWDGKNLDSPDHFRHMAYPTGPVDARYGVIWHQGPCPASHPVKVPTVLYEVAWNTAVFKDDWPTDGRQPLIMSMGDPTGFGQHGDYVFGWEGDSLQRAMDNCKDEFGHPDLCKELTLLTDEEMNSCTLPPLVPEKVEGEYLSALPGCNPEQSGPEPATMVPNCGAPSTTIGASPTPPA
ncbi:hypothetical protein NMY22_g5956 [Coprinellus aureogranulatus]|nr:hypothetical protein NMY22_g5956 [Coprinellus aureogranulatus]